MKKIILPIWGLFLMTIFLSCGGKKSDNTATAQDAVAVDDVEMSDVLDTDSEASVVYWRGFKPGGEHWGHMAVTSGRIAVQDGRLFGGSVDIAMNGIVVEDLEGEMAEELKAHLESADFFEVETYPSAHFELSDIPTEGLPLEGLTEIKGNFTLKGVTKNITIPVHAIKQDAERGIHTVESGTFRINRADWGVKYGSKSFFTNLGDAFISDEIELSFKLQTRAK